MINQVTLVGRLTKDPELKATPEGTAVTQITLAVNRNYRNHNGEVDADFVHCTLWRKAAENTCHYCRKGALIGITGRLQTRHYDNREGKRIYVTEVVAESVRFLSLTRPRAAASESTAAASSAVQYTRAAEPIAGSTDRPAGAVDSFVAHGDRSAGDSFIAHADRPAGTADSFVAHSDRSPVGAAAGMQGGHLPNTAVQGHGADQYRNATESSANDQRIAAEQQSRVMVTEWHADAAEPKKEERELAF
ncbi:hypothetical protein AM1BK_22720 [Neobacillus kokaensis]|uniref:Single-stranded DNA-binding protein n=1 Tax=Neobacillus kokaensis TaxID=2759023 RepID=A0ABQ3N1C8_9BACI|nr:single-stranded DNA-binding protein [Neobacillus kokaensis]GHH98729.1 hypothetical protein AM1BK_22720 [Neobacillus kokaensis]